MTQQETAAILTKAYLLFPNLRLERETVLAWHDLFKAEPASNFNRAVGAALKEPDRKFFPAPGEINAFLMKLKTPNRPDAESVFEDFCLGARKGASEARAHEKYANNEPALRALNAIGGWDTIRLADLKTELPFRKREFIRVYNDSSEQTEALNLLGEDRYATIAN